MLGGSETGQGNLLKQRWEREERNDILMRIETLKSVEVVDFRTENVTLDLS